MSDRGIDGWGLLVVPTSDRGFAFVAGWGLLVVPAFDRGFTSVVAVFIDGWGLLIVPMFDNGFALVAASLVDGCGTVALLKLAGVEASSVSGMSPTPKEGKESSTMRGINTSGGGMVSLPLGTKGKDSVWMTVLLGSKTEGVPRKWIKSLAPSAAEERRRRRRTKRKGDGGPKVPMSGLTNHPRRGFEDGKVKDEGRRRKECYLGD
ncbi:hypothetical protein B296_00003235 [Ensete ventricosum]|uniref:Uncharacterized protein n=1 Tax=Ensete ventricosum TaxID=4639 RepID=A0A427AWZ4_ENSVE|nr:hypothetical protein B296_00003235 [Ensete ventricosum]